VIANQPVAVMHLTACFFACSAWGRQQFMVHPPGCELERAGRVNAVHTIHRLTDLRRRLATQHYLFTSAGVARVSPTLKLKRTRSLKGRRWM